MGTNYYLRTGICKTCDRYDEMHICKSMTSFQAHPDKNIRSWEDWKVWLRLDGAEVWSEYQYQIPTEKFIADVERVDRASRRRQYDWVVEHLLVVGPDHRDRYWLDANGFSFYDGEFS